MLEAGQVFKRGSEVWCVTYVNASSALIVLLLTDKQKPITTRRGKTKYVKAVTPPMRISSNALVELVDPVPPFIERLKERAMAEETKAAVEETKEAAPRKTQVYVRTEKESKEMKGQGAVVLNALNEMGQATVTQLVDATKGMFETRQDPARVVGFYLSKFKREGLAKVVEATPKAVAEPAAAIAE